MTESSLLLHVRRAQAEAVSHVIGDWQPPEDLDQRAKLVDQLISGLLDLAQQAKAVVNDVFECMPRDGTLFDYMNRRRLELTDYFKFALEGAQKLRDFAWSCEKAGRSVRSLPLLDRIIRDLERLRSDTLSHWVEFDPKQEIGSDEEYMSNDEFLQFLESQMSEEARRELQSRMAPVGS
jgi:hypothetical protein